MSACPNGLGFRRPPRANFREDGLTRLPERGIVAGVCAGIANYLEMPRLGVRLLYVLAVLVSGIFPLVVLYAILYFVLPVRRALPSAREGFDELSAYDLRRQRRELVGCFSRLEERLGKLESYVISSEYEWERKYRDIK